MKAVSGIGSRVMARPISRRLKNHAIPGPLVAVGHGVTPPAGADVSKVDHDGQWFAADSQAATNRQSPLLWIVSQRSRCHFPFSGLASGR